MKKIVVLLLVSLGFVAPVSSHVYLEKDYQNQWCSANNGKTEVRFSDRTRVDCLTDEYAIEFDFAYKWAEAIGQSLYYASCTGKQAGVVLIMENGQKDVKYLIRLKNVAEKYKIKVWTITPQDVTTVRNCGNS